MDLNLILIITGIILLLWLLILTILYITSVRHYKKITLGEGESLEHVMNTVFKGLETLHGDMSDNTEKISDLQEGVKTHVQKVSLLRFNPFGDTGGDQSFSLAMLNDANDGIVLSSLHGRSGTRIYAKPVEKGKGKEYELSTEEQEVIDLAIK